MEVESFGGGKPINLCQCTCAQLSETPRYFFGADAAPRNDGAGSRWWRWSTGGRCSPVRSPRLAAGHFGVQSVAVRKKAARPPGGFGAAFSVGCFIEASAVCSRPGPPALISVKGKTGLRAETARKADRDHGLPSQGTVLGPTSPATSPNVSARGRARTACSQGIERRVQIRAAHWLQGANLMPESRGRRKRRPAKTVNITKLSRPPSPPTTVTPPRPPTAASSPTKQPRLWAAMKGLISRRKPG